MEKEHRMSITPVGTFYNFLQNIFFGRGKNIKIDNKEYTLRESGIYSENDPTRLTMLRSLENQANLFPRSRLSSFVRFGNDETLVNQDCYIKFTKIEEVPSSNQDSWDLQHITIEGAPYRVEIEGDPNQVGITVNKAIENGKNTIIIYSKVNNYFPSRIEISSSLESRVGPFKRKR